MLLFLLHYIVSAKLYYTSYLFSRLLNSKGVCGAAHRTYESYAPPIAAINSASVWLPVILTRGSRYGLSPG